MQLGNSLHTSMNSIMTLDRILIFDRKLISYLIVYNDT